MMSQTCHDFARIVVMDDQTSAAYKDILDGIQYPNIRFIYTNTGVARAFRRSIEPGGYTLITARFDLFIHRTRPTT